jgi:hypothetical protein
MADGALKYPWQQFLLEAFMEFDPDRLPVKIDEARRVISARLCGLRPDDVDEQIALRDAMRSLHILEPKGQIA